MNTPHALLSALLLTAGCGWASGNGVIVTQERDVPSFHAAELHGGVQASVSPGAPSVRIRIDENLQDHVLTEVLGGTLVVRVAPGLGLSPTVFEADVSAPALSAVAASGGSAIRGEVEPFGAFLVTGSGGARLELTGVFTSVLSLSLSGGSGATLAGATDEATVTASGGSQLRLEATPVRAMHVDLSGGSRGRVYVTRSVRGTLSGGSQLELLGAPPLRQLELSGGSAVLDAH